MKNNKSVGDVMTTIASMANPFNVGQASLVCISSGVELDHTVSDALLGAEKLGEGQFTEFCDKLLGNKPDVFEKIKKSKLSTFSTKNLKVKDSKGRELAIKSSRNLFARVLVLSNSGRPVDLKELFSYSLCEYPLSLATVSGIR